MNSFRRRRARLVSRAPVIWLVLVAFCAHLVPMPMGTFSESGFASESGEQYPCQGSLCGCKSAVQCWTSCCCRTPSKRLAWAAEHNVTPPAYFANILREEKSHKAASKKQCCVAARSTDNPSQPAKLKGSKTRFVIGILSSKCQGKSSLFTTVPWATLTTKFVPSFAVAPHSTMALPSSVSKPEIFDRPPTPPPRSYLAG